jgi:hypothetical protein
MGADALNPYDSDKGTSQVINSESGSLFNVFVWMYRPSFKRVQIG